MYFLGFFSVAKEVIHAEVSNKCGWVGVCTVTLGREEPQRVFGVTRVILWLFLSQAFQVRSLHGVQESQGSSKKPIHAE